MEVGGAHKWTDVKWNMYAYGTYTHMHTHTDTCENTNEYWLSTLHEWWLTQREWEWVSENYFTFKICLWSECTLTSGCGGEWLCSPVSSCTASCHFRRWCRNPCFFEFRKYVLLSPRPWQSCQQVMLQPSCQYADLPYADSALCVWLVHTSIQEFWSWLSTTFRTLCTCAQFWIDIVIQNSGHARKVVDNRLQNSCSLIGLDV